MSSHLPQPEPGQFTLAVLMQHTGKLLDDRLRVRFERLGLPPAQGHVVHLLEGGEALRQSDLAALLKVSAPTVSGILKRMQAADLIQRSADAHDARATRVSLTPQGARLGKAAREVVSEVEQTLIAGLSRAELRAAHTLLRQLRHNLGGQTPGAEPSVAEILP